MLITAHQQLRVHATSVTAVTQRPLVLLLAHLHPIEHFSQKEIVGSDHEIYDPINRVVRSNQSHHQILQITRSWIDVQFMHQII